MRRREPLLLLLVLLAALGGGGCAMRGARAYERELLVNRIMSFGAEARKDARLSKSFDAREGSTGGTGGAGGGCACN